MNARQKQIYSEALRVGFMAGAAAASHTAEECIKLPTPIGAIPIYIRMMSPKDMTDEQIKELAKELLDSF